MSSSNDLVELERWPKEVLVEIVREGELQVQAQLQTSLAADSRALTIAGACLAAATTLLGAAAALSKSSSPDTFLIMVASALGLVLLLSAGLAVYSARPVPFGFPGNDPANWAPAGWREPPKQGQEMKRARIEQAITLQETIEANRKASANNARLIRWALGFAYAGSLVAGLAILSILVSRSLGGR
jgi:hypothetical protein